MNLAINVILKNAKYTNVVDSISLISSLYTIGPLIEPTKWRVRFVQQKLENLPIVLGRISVGVNRNGVYAMTGHWYKDVYIPPIDNITKEAAKEIIIGEKIIWYSSWTGQEEYTIDKESKGNQIDKIIYPLHKEEFIEMRVIWKIQIKFWLSTIGWYAYVDTSARELLGFAQQFVT